ncbi:hypothetical protein ACFE04_003016 [Oxalis oulophora]
MASKMLLVVVFVLNLIAFILAVIAEQRRSTAKLTKDVDSSYCVYDSDISSGLGAGAFLFLLLSQLLIMLATKCLCCGKALRPSGSRACAVILFITCWHHLSRPFTCTELRKGVFGAGAAFIVFTGILSELYYVSYSKANNQLLQGKDTGVRMGPL